ncbi:MAG: fluoride efflux transporter CrcB [Muribaculaceae bacterium]|nr:fluoride efflux transporter CrcB [Muribaculaceae bacterium]
MSVFLGSGIGGVCRYAMSMGIDKLVVKAANSGGCTQFPFSTFAVNILGCFIIGVLYALADKGVSMSPATKLLLTTGFCGGLTTFSTFSHENLLLFTSGRHLTLLIYAVLSLLTGFLAARGGHDFVERVF